MFYRKIIDFLEDWSNRDNRKPLVLRGARQVGKTTLVNQFAVKYACYIYLNLDKEDEKAIFETSATFNEKLDAIFFLKGKKKGVSPTLIFIDEIQNSPKAVALLRYFYEEAPDIHTIAAGSLLESLIDKQISFPVGRVEYLAVRPCSFNEFLSATGEDASLEVLSGWPIPAYAHEKLQSLFNRYTLIGGMPAVIANYAKNKDLIRLNTEYQSLITGYIDDVEKYAPNNNSMQHIRHILRTGFRFGCQRIRFERFGESEYRSRDMSDAFRLLEKTMLMELVQPTGSTEIPYIPDLKKSPRLHWLDTGLLNYSAGVQIEVFGAKELSSVWRGLVAEHIVGQELIAEDLNVLAKRTFWIREVKNSNAEVDYLISHANRLIPLEVKSGAGSTLKSLHLFMDQAPHSLAIRIWNQPFSESTIRTVGGKIFTLLNVPYYLVSKLGKVIERY